MPYRSLAHVCQPVDSATQSFLTGTSTQPPSPWESTGLRLDSGLTMSPSTVPATQSLDSVTQTSPLTGLTAMSHDVSSRSNLPAQGIQSRSVLPARGQRSRDGHERKRSRLSLDTNTPLDSVDYWIDFDNDDSLASIPEAFEPRSTAKVKKNKAPMRRCVLYSRCLNPLYPCSRSSTVTDTLEGGLPISPLPFPQRDPTK